MSNVKVTDKSGGKYQAVIEFSYGECERLPFNILRRINARIETIPDGGARAVADFDIRSQRGSAGFLEMLELFGQDGSYEHGSAADPLAMAKTAPAANGGAIRANLGDGDEEMELEGTLSEK